MREHNLQRQLKLLLCLLMTVIISLSSIQLGVAEKVEVGQQIDTVIVLDNSSSMRYRSKETNKVGGNDIEGYRFDAAQMFISMCDMNGSRVAVIPFAGDIHESASTDFVVLDSENSRDQLINQLDKLRNPYPGQDTNLGKALSLAVEMLANRSDKSNNPMILVLSDGQNSIGLKGKSVTIEAPVWDAESSTFHIESHKFKSSDDASAYSDELCELAVEAACDMDIPIYTVPLFEGSVSDPKVKAYYDVLQRMANSTGGLCIPLNADNVDRLPEKFGEMLAERLGSSLVVELTPNAMGDGLYQVKLPMLNNSVMEANVYIPVVEETAKRGIRASQVWLYDPNGIDVSAGNGNSVTCTESEGHFRLYKLRQPIPTGEWTLQFRIEGDVDPKTIAFSVLYNYDVTLRTFVGTSPASLTDMDATFNKKDTLLVQSQFYSNSTQAPSSDSMLYNQVIDGEDWYTIRARYEMRDVNGRVLFDGEIPSDNMAKFSGKIDLAKVFVDEKGNSKLMSGKYELFVTVDGAGLSRETSQWVELTNSPVSCTSELAFSAVVDDPNKPETREPMLLSFKISDYFNDPDSDPISYNLAVDNTISDNTEGLTGTSSRTEDILPLQLVEKEDGVYVEGTTIKDTKGRIHFGSARYILTVSDNEESITVPLVVNLSNKTVGDTSNYSCNVNTTGIDDHGIAQKNSEVTFTMSLTDKDGKADTTGSINLYSCQVSIIDANNTSVLLNEEPAVMIPGKANTLVYSYQLGNKECSAKAMCEFFYDGEPCGSTEIPFRVVNAYPRVITDALMDYPDQIAYQSKNFPPVLQHITTDEELTFTLKDLFEEDDNETLTIHDPVFTSANPDVKWEDIISFERDENDQVLLKVVGEGKVNMSITAEDGDGTTAVFTKDYSLVDMTKRWTIYWCIVIAAIMAGALIIHALVIAFKPVYDGRVSIENYEGGSLGASAVTNLPTGKKRKKTAPLRSQVDPSLAQKYGIDVANLDSVKIAPRKHVRDGAVEIWQDGRTDGLEITLNGEPLTKKHKVWSNGGQVVIRSLASNGTIRLVHTLESGPVFGGADVVGSDPFNSAGDGSFDMGGFDNCSFGDNDSFGGSGFGSGDSFSGNDSFGGGNSFGSNDNGSGDNFGNFGDFGA